MRRYGYIRPEEVTTSRPPPNTATLRSGKRTAILENGGRGNHIYITKKNISGTSHISAVVLGGGGQRRGVIRGVVDCITEEVARRCGK